MTEPEIYRAPHDPEKCIYCITLGADSPCLDQANVGKLPDEETLKRILQRRMIPEQ